MGEFLSQLFLNGFTPSDAELVAGMGLEDRVARAVALLRAHQPADGYYLAFSGGKDSCAIKKLAQLAGVRFESWYNNTTIDPPELVRFVKRQHSDVQWNHPPTGNMLHRIGEGPSGAAPPTRFSRWCCREYKERGGKGRSRIFGVRAEESGKRKRRWHEVSKAIDGFPAICPIVYWTGAQLWEFIRAYSVPYCELYDEGQERIGCVLCPLKNVRAKEADIARWPKYAAAWRRAVTANWEKWRNIPRVDGGVRFQGKFATAEEFWHWWMTDERPDVMYEDCQSMTLWTNEEEALDITVYEHHGERVSVQSHLQGKHREHCLCFQGCTRFKPGTPENCEIAQAVYGNCVAFNIVSPVWECPKFARE